MNMENKDEVVYLYLDDIIPNRFQPREVFDEKALKELAVSIKEHGVIQPIIVRSVNGKYEIIAGERRYKASALAGATKIPAIVRNLDDKESSKVALLENLQRKNLNPIEEARTYQKILEIDQMTQDELAKTMGKSQSAVANKLRLLALPDEVQDSLLKEQISERHARALLNIPEPRKQKEILKKVIATKMTVRALEEEIKLMYPKEEKEMENIIPTENFKTASSTDFVNSSPLMPTTNLPEDTSNYGKIIVAPPEGEEQNNTPKFINYGEIDEDEDEEEEEPFNLNSSMEPLDINKMKESATDIHSVKNSSSADLDSLLNLHAPIQEEPSETKPEGFKFITPAEEIVKTDANKQNHDHIKDYFQTPDLISVELPTEVQSPRSEEVSLTSFNKDPGLINTNIGTYTTQQATTRIRELIQDLEEHGIKVTSDEMDFEKSYQIIIKLDKMS